MHSFRPRVRSAVTCPATLETVGHFGAPTAGHVEDVSDRVNAAQKLCRKMNCKCRTKFPHSVADAMERADVTDIATVMSREIGKPNANEDITNIPPVFRY
ncbi:acyl-CoA reductase-like NAD-dependent aldehyde dehydrogenase [Sagittula marina]|uniref:Acyl-CoA reductase-like NAD-dependent aldehyde dehydrogenase n=1 Tax=Sagittula marina TaxID=943940 RepID=A0A7W6DSB9_9RHOB|nr:acyl-CoA reductase-like NAD-dependent aldehyde dehydrogenase [Sagittula marina]